MRRIALMAGTLVAITGSAVAFAAGEPNATAPAPEATPDPLRGDWVALLDGALAGHLSSVDRCGIEADVAETVSGKQVAGFRPEACDLELSAALSPEIAAWATAALNGRSDSRTLQLVRLDDKAAPALELTGATLRSLTIPKLVQGSEVPGRLKLSVQAQTLRSVPKPVLPPLPRVRSPRGSFDVLVDGEPVAVDAIGPWTATVEPASERLPDIRVPGARVSRVRVDDLPLRLYESNAPETTLAPWLADFVHGKNGSDYERTTTLAFGQFRFDFRNTGPARGDLAPRADGTHTYSLYTDRASIAMR